jgi:hypothetical protein
MPWLGRWCAVDPLEAQRAGHTSYDYGGNNPVNRYDLDGKTDTDPNKKNAKISSTSGTYVISVADAQSPKSPSTNTGTIVPPTPANGKQNPPSNAKKKANVAPFDPNASLTNNAIIPKDGQIAASEANLKGAVVSYDINRIMLRIAERGQFMFLDENGQVHIAPENKIEEIKRNVRIQNFNEGVEGVQSTLGAGVYLLTENIDWAKGASAIENAVGMGLALKQGQAPRLGTNGGLGVPRNFKPSAKSAPIVKPNGNNAYPYFAANGGENLALGLRSNLNEFTTATGFKNYRQFTTGGFQPAEIEAAIKNSSNNLHFNLTDFARWRYSKYAANPTSPTNGNITNWELHTIYNTPGALQRTTFYKFISGSYQVVPKPF